MDNHATAYIKLVGLQIRGLKPIQHLDLPADGLGWVHGFPDMVLIGGGNGSGKTTLLELLAFSLGLLENPLLRGVLSLRVQGDGREPIRAANVVQASELGRDVIVKQLGDFDVLIDWEVSPGTVLRCLIGSEAFAKQHSTEHAYGFCRRGQRWFDWFSPSTTDTHQLFNSIPSLAKVVYLPHDRELIIPDESFKAIGKISAGQPFIYRWSPPREWKHSLEAILYNAKGQDLFARDEGRPEEAVHFEPYAKAFAEFFDNTKRLLWHRGDLFVEVVETGDRHLLSELSSGEQQIILLAAELLSRWQPGSLVLIDEPELHLHEEWQRRLWLLLERFHRERGGQVIVATQSSTIWGMGEPGTKVLLDRR